MAFLDNEDSSLEAALAFLEEYDDGDELFTEEMASVSEEKAGATSGSGDAAETSNKPRRKRVRKRQKDEIVYLRSRVRELEERLQHLQKGVSNRTSGDEDDGPIPESPASTLSTSSSTAPSTDGSATVDESRIAKPSAQLISVWEKVAARQNEQRQQAELENAKLKEMLEEQIRVARSLEKVLYKRTSAELLNPNGPKAKRMKWLRESNSENDAALMQDLLREIDEQYQLVDSVFGDSRFTGRGAQFRDIQVCMDEDAEEMYIEVLDSKILPFELTATAAAFWQHMTRGESVMNKTYYRETKEITNDTVARSFAIEMKAGPMRGDFRGKQCLRRYVEEDRTILVWNMLAEPMQLSGQSMGGLLLRQRAWIELTRSTSDPAQATQLRSRYVMSPDVYADEVPGQERKVGAITDFVLHSVHGTLNSSHQMIENILIQSMLAKEKE
ncbi:hypothetical protein Poli38472_004972 [Pythium oligandrum]|uniref:M96 mating-specific protein family n=1 Tax=Pythium oligandrum TaxID=41045 RepID=A0A8K1CC22_PYTOL|nr:hypothetical protein Poli38472_004972 [Pythium oligandrum]|eukprot:TMW59903.1 hypothetical protein Poli38472_004972 [Pythium oligandrum]